MLNTRSVLQQQLDNVLPANGMIKLQEEAMKNIHNFNKYMYMYTQTPVA